MNNWSVLCDNISRSVKIRSALINPHLICHNSFDSLEMVTDTTIDELYDYLIVIRDHLIREKEFSDFNFDPDTKDQDVKKLNCDTLKSFIHQIFH